MITKYEELTIGKYQQIIALGEGEHDLEYIAILSGMSENELLHLPLTQYRELRDSAGFLAYEPTIGKVRKEYRLNGTTYTFRGNYRDLTTAQYIDFTEYAKQEGDRMIEILSLVLIPKGKAYNEGYDILQAQADIKEHLAITDAIAIRDFFVARLESYLHHSLTYLSKMQARVSKSMMKKIRARIAVLTALQKSGVGLTRLTAFPNSHAIIGARYIQ